MIISVGYQALTSIATERYNPGAHQTTMEESLPHDYHAHKVNAIISIINNEQIKIIAKDSANLHHRSREHRRRNCEEYVKKQA